MQDTLAERPCVRLRRPQRVALITALQTHPKFWPLVPSAAEVSGVNLCGTLPGSFSNLRHRSLHPLCPASIFPDLGSQFATRTQESHVPGRPLTLGTF